MAGSRPLNLSELNAMMYHVSDRRDRAYLLLTASTGARVNEARQIKVSDIMSPTHELTGYCVLHRRNAKNKAATRETPLPARALRALSEWLQEHPMPHGDVFLFPHPGDATRPATSRTLQRIVQRAKIAAGLKGRVTPHSLRKFFGTRIYVSTSFDLATTAAALGHRNPAATPAYLEIDAEKRNTAIRDIFHDPHDDLLLHATL